MPPSRSNFPLTIRSADPVGSSAEPVDQRDGPLYEPGVHQPNCSGGRALGQAVDRWPLSVGEPVHSMWTTLGERAPAALFRRLPVEGRKADGSGKIPGR